VKRALALPALLLAAGLFMTGCAAGAESEAPAETAAAEASEPAVTKTPTPTPTPTPPPDSDGDGVVDAEDAFPSDGSKSVQLYYPSGDPVLEGYPVVVETAQLDYRLANWVKTPLAVALAPGVYAGYNPAVTDLSTYLSGPADGDCAVRDMYQFQGGACWSGVLASPAEPAS
jgi:hypothetical protein